MSDSIDPILLDTYKLLLLRPGMYLGEDTDTRSNRRRLLWIAAEMTILQRANEKFLPPEESGGPISILDSFNNDPEKRAWIETETRALRRSALQKDFWKTWPMGRAEDGEGNDGPPPPKTPMSFFKGTTFTDKPTADEKNLEDMPGYQEIKKKYDALSQEYWGEDGIDANLSFESLIDEESKGRDGEQAASSYPLNIPGVTFSPVQGEDVVLEHSEDKYKPPVRVKITLPQAGSYDGPFVHDVEATAAKAFGLRKSVREKLIKNLLSPLEGLTGLDAIKSHIETMVRLALVTQHRTQAGLQVYPLGGHMLFLGNPGTGKTHVARLLADILYKAGVLKTGHVIEADRAALTGEYIGWSEAKTHLVCKAAQGGILFIDEAYALSDSDSARDFGYEAINVLNKRMEDDADKFIVIAAGYKDRMENFLLSNPGLRSRFQHSITFRDYKADEMVAIFEGFCRRYDYQLDRGAREKLTVLLRSIRGQAQARFGNARGVRTLFEKTIACQAIRLMTLNALSHKAMRTITAADIPAAETLYTAKVAYLPTKVQ